LLAILQPSHFLTEDISMKRLFTTVTACVLALAVGGTVFAQGRMGGCNECNQGNQGNLGAQGAQGAGQPDQFRKFQMDTLDLRQDMMNKRFELQRENLKGTPDAAKVAGLTAEVTAIQAKINDIRVQSGLPDKGKRDGECFKMDGGCFKQDGMGGCNKQNGMGGCNKQNGMGGCNGQPCGQK
jgi:hypothetical protein